MALLDLEKINQSLDNQVGDDPRYDDDFLWVKDQLDQMTGADYDRIVRLCCQLLELKTKDLRVAGYLLLALTYVFGVEGLLEGLQCWLALLRQFGKKIYPQRTVARDNAIMWVNQSRLLDFLRRQPTVVTQQERDTIQLHITDLNQQLKVCFPQSQKQIYILNDWMATLDQQASVVTDVAVKEELQEKHNDDQADDEQEVTQVLTADVSMLDEHKAYHQQRQLARYYLQQNDYMQALVLSRLFWLRLSGLPPHDESGVTALATLESLQLTRFNYLCEHTNHHEMIQHAEQCFSLPGGAYYFRLTYELVKSLTALQQVDVAQFLIAQLLALLTRFPKLMQLKFNNGDPFFDEGTSLWVQQLQLTQQHRESPLSERSDDVLMKQRDGMTFVDHWVRRVEQEYTTLQEQVTWLQKVSFDDEGLSRVQGDFYRLWVMNRLALKHQQIALVSETFTGLLERIDQHRLIEWQPKLVLCIYRQFKQFLQQSSVKITPLKLQYEQSVQQVLLKLDPAGLLT